MRDSHHAEIIALESSLSRSYWVINSRYLVSVPPSGHPP